MYFCEKKKNCKILPWQRKDARRFRIYFNRQKDAESANYSMLIARLDVIW